LPYEGRGQIVGSAGKRSEEIPNDIISRLRLAQIAALGDDTRHLDRFEASKVSAPVR
jgi:hypothetical protein